MLARVRRIEKALAPALSPFAAMPGGLEAWEAECRAGIDAGHLDGPDVRVAMLADRRRHHDGSGRSYDILMLTNPLVSTGTGTHSVSPL